VDSGAAGLPVGLLRADADHADWQARAVGAADRAGWFSTELFERYQRSEWALVAAPAEMYVQGVSTRKVATHAGVRESRLIGLMVYDFARIGAAWHTVEDVYKQNRRLWVRLREKDGKRHAMPCHHNFEEYLVGYPDGPGCAAIPRAAIPHDRPRPPASSHGRFCRRQTPIR